MPRRRDVTELRRSIGYVIQQVGLFPHQTIGENVATVPRLLGWPKERLRSRSDELLALVGLDPAKYRDRFPSQLSGGERQRVGVARALAVDPPIMLMDEPFGAVDPIVRDRLQNEFLRLQEELAKTILFVTHDIDEAIKMGDLVAVFQDGGVVAQFGTPAEILANPASEFVARFVGADRGLKRLALSRVSDLELDPAGHRRRRRGRRRGARDRAQAAPFGYLLLVDAARRPHRLDPRGRDPGERAARRRRSPTRSRRSVNRRTTLKDALSMMLDADVQAGDRGRPHRRGPGDHDRRAGHRDDARGRARPAASRVVDDEAPMPSRRACPTTAWPPRRAEPTMEGQPLVDFDWIFGPPRRHRRRALVQHVAADASSRSSSGFVIALFLAIWAVRQPRVYGPIAGHQRHPLHDPEHRRVRLPAARSSGCR